MKGTLFSADFVKDSNGNVRLLELNTDTAFTSGSLSHVDFTDFLNILSTNEINEVHVIGKQMHENFINHLSQSLHESGIINIFSKTIEESTIIYPTSIEDSPTKFILRCAYDESALFDSTYCKQKEEIFSLFYDNNDTASIAEFYVSSSNFNVDILRKENNSQFIPDVCVKDITNVHSEIGFYKIHGSGSLEQNFINFIEEIGDNKLITNYYFNDNDTIQTSIRSFNIIYGTNLDVINLTNVIVPAVFEKPEFVEYNENSNFTLFDIKHYYEFATNNPLSKELGGGIFEDETITDIDGNPICVANASIGDSYKSVFISGSPDTDNSIEFTAWSIEGSELPSGSFVTSSILVNSIKQDLKRKLISHIITEDSASFRMVLNSHLLIYDSSSNEIRYKSVYRIDPETDFLLKNDGNLSKIFSNEIEVLENTHSTYRLDFESVDTYLLHDSGVNIKVVAHNACFPKGTKITLANKEIKNIEDINEGDNLISYDTHNKMFTTGRVSKLNVSNQTDLVYIKTDSNHELKLTYGHTIYANNKWIQAKELKVGDSLINSDGKNCKITFIEIIEGEFEVYHILNVGNDHSYFANEILVHNFSFCFIAGTKITLFNGDVKNIEDVVVNEEVLTYNEESGITEKGIVSNLKQHEVHSVIRLTFDNNNIIITTHEHPFFVQDKGWVKAGELQPLDMCKKVDGSESLISTVETLEETHTVYNLLSVSENHNFYANGILVHNK
jgi:intein/homing endonuclease